MVHRHITPQHSMLLDVMCFLYFWTQQGFNKAGLDKYLVRFRASILQDLEAKALYRGMLAMKSQKILLYFESEPLSTPQNSGQFFCLSDCLPLRYSISVSKS